MKTLTVKQPWASLICQGLKDVENRTWPTKFRGRVLIHASKIEDKRWFDKCSNGTASEVQGSITKMMTREEYYALRSCIIGSVEIVDCVINHPSVWAKKTDNFLIAQRMITYNWVLANPYLFPEPIPAKGKLSFWDYPNILSEPEVKKRSVILSLPATSQGRKPGYEYD